MKLKSIVLAAFLASCTMTSPVYSPDIKSFDVDNKNVQHSNSIDNEDKFYIALDVLVFKSEIKKHPIVWQNTVKAMAEWSRHIPVYFVVNIEDDTFPYIPIFNESLVDKPNIIQIRMLDLEEKFGLPENLLGMWDHKNNRILLNTKLLSDEENLTYSTALHEFGHLFGVPHVVGKQDSLYTGYIVLDDNQAHGYVMYPRLFTGHLQDTLSELEISLAKNYLVHSWGTIDRNRENCHKFLVDKHE